MTLLKGKIHRASVKQAELDYVGSITIDEALMDAAGIIEYEQVQIVDVNNGSRFTTYVIAGERESGLICLNGAAARQVTEEAKAHAPRVVFVDDDNRIVKTTRYEKHGKLCDM